MGRRPGSARQQVQTQSRHRPCLQQGASHGASYSSLGGTWISNSRRCVRHPSWTFASTPPLLLAAPGPPKDIRHKRSSKHGLRR